MMLKLLFFYVAPNFHKSSDVSQKRWLSIIFRFIPIPSQYATKILKWITKYALYYFLFCSFCCDAAQFFWIMNIYFNFIDAENIK